MKSTTLISIWLLAAGPFLHGGEARLVDEPYLSSLRREAAARHPATRAAGLRTAAADSDVRGIRLWDDPMVGLSIMAANPEMRRNEGDIRLSFEQPIPKPGLFAAERDRAIAMQRAETENARLSALEVAAAAARDAIELALSDESIAIQQTQVGWLDAMAGTAREMAINPDATGIDALRLQTELVREKEILAAARRTRESLARRLNLRLGRPLDAPWPALRLADSAAPTPVAAAEIARISRHNPRVRSMREMAAAAGADVRIADRERQPQFAVGVETALYSGGDARSLGVGLKMSLPYFNRGSYDAKVRASELRESAAVDDIAAVRLQVADEILAATTAAANAAAQARAYSGAVYQDALAATDSVQASWISSRSSVTDLLAANRLLFSIRLEQRRFVAMQLAALEELNLLVPRP